MVPRLATTGRQIPTLGVTTPRTSLEVLSLEMPFTQSPVLESRDFVKEASRRGVRLDESLLEDLHRKKMLIPFYWAHPGLSRKLDVTDVSRSRMAQLGNSGVTPRLIPPASNGEVTDPEHWPFRRWSRSTPRQVRPDMHSGIYYSRHQLLLLPLIRRYVEEHQTFFVGRPPKDLRSFTRLNPDFMPDAGYEAACSEWRSVAVILSALDTVILPELSRKVSWPDQWRAMRDAFDADQALEWLGLSRETTRELASRLLWNANGIDESGDLYDLIRRADPSTWESFRGQLLISLDYRIAAEIVSRVVDMAEGVEVEDDDETSPIGAQRLTTRRRDLEELLTATGLSPHPSVVVVVEGSTEMILFPRVMAALGAPIRSDRIRVENREGLDESIRLLAKYSARPLLGVAYEKYVLLDKPPTRVLVLADPEKDYSDAAKCANQRRIIAETIVSELPQDLHEDLLADGSELVTVRTWPSGPFEFAHFDDEELADGLLAMAQREFPGGRPELIKKIAGERVKPHATKKRKGPDVATVWAAWVTDYDFSKTAFAEEMWPLLEQKIREAIDSGSPRPPIMDGASDAIRLSRLPRSLVVVERTIDPAPSPAPDSAESYDPDAPEAPRSDPPGDGTAVEG